MKIDKRLSEEFGMPIAAPEPWTLDRIIERVFANLIPFTASALLLAIGALIGSFYPPIIYWFFGVAGFTALCYIAVVVIVLASNGFDIDGDDHMGYPGS